jgi:acyl-CoA reductase-like NAD-dependent aldehyde dehydrogenase
VSQPPDDQSPQPSPEDIQRALERAMAAWQSGKMQPAFSRERIAEIAETLRRLQEAYSPERMAETLRRLQEAYSPERMAETLRRIQDNYSPERMRAIGEALESSLGAAAHASLRPSPTGKRRLGGRTPRRRPSRRRAEPSLRGSTCSPSPTSSASSTQA